MLVAKYPGGVRVYVCVLPLDVAAWRTNAAPPETVRNDFTQTHGKPMSSHVLAIPHIVPVISVALWVKPTICLPFRRKVNEDERHRQLRWFVPKWQHAK